ncbi:MAG: FG-GAP-like repeat-containing protein [Polyangiales bacterium]
MRCRSVLAGLVVCLGAGRALADDWVMARHDAARTGASSGRTNLPQPAVRWRHYLGGGLSPNQLMITDVDGDGVTDAVYIAGTRVIAKHADGVLVWESELIEATSLANVADLDGDGRVEVVVAGARGAIYVLAGDSGRVRWELPRAERAQGGDARVVDVDGDGALDLYVGQCTEAPAAAYAYNFRGGFDAPRRLWTLNRAIQCGTGFDNVGDLDGDGVPEVIPQFGRTEMEIYSGRTGQRVATVPAPASGGFAGSIFGRFANVDDDPGQEFFVLTNFWRSTAPTDGGRRVAMYDWEGGATPGLRLRWESSWPMPDNGDVAFFHDSVADLDGDGHPEVAVSFLDAATRRWTFRLHDARTGTVLATREDSQYVGTASLGGAGLTALLIDDDRRTVAVRWFGGRLEEAWRVERHRPATLRDVSVSSSDGLNTRVMAMQFDDDPALELVMIPFDPDLAPEARVVTSLVALDVDGAAPRPLGTFNAPPQTTVLVTQQGSGLSRQYPQTVAVTSDGYLLSLDREMVSTNRLVNGEFIIPGMRVGGYFSGAGTWGHTPSIASLPSSNGGARRAVVVRDSRPALLRLDATSASLEAPPRVEWERPNAAWPVLVDANGDGQTGRSCGEAATSRCSTLTGRAPSGSGARPSASRVADAQRPSRCGARERRASTRSRGSSDASNLHRAFVFAGDGTPRWSAFNRVPHSPSQLSLRPTSADGTDDLVTVINTALVIDGADGSVAREGQALPYASPVVAAFSGAEPEVYHGRTPPTRSSPRTPDAPPRRGPTARAPS